MNQNRKDVFVVPSTSGYRIDLESQGIDVRRDEPSAGAIGMAALMASMGPIYGINSALTIATTIGTSADTSSKRQTITQNIPVVVTRS